jgi:exonuclease III
MILPGYTSYWTCSQAKKVRTQRVCLFLLPPKALRTSRFARRTLQGYAGSAVMIRTGLDHKVTFGIGIHEHDQEGRAVTVELDSLYVVGLYVPNSGTPVDKFGDSVTPLSLSLCVSSSPNELHLV